MKTLQTIVTYSTELVWIIYLEYFSLLYLYHLKYLFVFKAHLNSSLYTYNDGEGGTLLLITHKTVFH